MADVKISQLPAATTPLDGTELTPIVQSGTTKRVSVANLTVGRALTASSLTLSTPLSVANGGTGLTSLGTGIDTFLETPTSANLAAAVTDETGTGALVFGTTPTFTTSALFPAGTVGAPGISVSGDTNTGIYFPAADTIGFVEGGVEAMRLDSTGVVLVASTTSALYDTNSGGDVGNIYKFRVKSSPSNAYSIFAGENNASTYIGGARTNTADKDIISALIQFNSGSNTAGSETGFITFNVKPSGGGAYANGEAARIDSSGNLLVNRTSGATFSCAVSALGGSGKGAVYAAQSVTNFFALGSFASNASYADFIYLNDCARSANSAFSFIYCRSSTDADVEFNLRGDGNGYADGTWNNNGADYAEYFESATGAALTVGASVVLEGNKVREAISSDDINSIIGVVRPKEPSKASMVIGNTAWNKWADKYLTDDFDRYILEEHDVVEWTDRDGKFHSYETHAIPADTVVPEDAVTKTHDDKGNRFYHYKINPAYDPDLEYVPRENRPEWVIIGLMGQVKILKGQPVNSRWIKMRDVSTTVEEWMIR